MSHIVFLLDLVFGFDYLIRLFWSPAVPLEAGLAESPREAGLTIGNAGR